MARVNGSRALGLLLVLAFTAGADDTDIFLGVGIDSGLEFCEQSPIEAASFVAATISSRPVSVAGDVADVYIPLLRVAPGERWSGNVKKLKLIEHAVPDPNSSGTVTSQLVAGAPLSDPPQPAVAADGRIRRDALTFWTDPAGRDVLAFNPAQGEVSGRDGRSVERGGAGQQLTGYLAHTVGAANNEPGARQVFTENPLLAGQLLALDHDMIELHALAPYLDPFDQLDGPAEAALIRWMRGQDAFDTDGDDNVLESREWLVGGLLHSKPLVVNYGARPGSGHRASNPDVRLFFGTNDGVFRSVRNTWDDVAASESGAEAWAFVPLELLAIQGPLAGQVADEGAGRVYGMDGEAVAYTVDSDLDGNIEPAEGDRVWVYIGQRRGGRAIYAFDVTDPDVPLLKWKITPDSPGFEQLALTFSTPRIARLNHDGGVPRPALVFGGGYNGGWGGETRVGKDGGAEVDTVGNAVYVVDADSGELIWRAVGPNGGAQPANSGQLYYSADMQHSIPSPLTVVDSDGNGLTDRAYVGDTGGNVWRIELTEYDRRQPGSHATDEANWFVSSLARLGGEGEADRRFFHAPDYVKTRDGQGNYDGVVITSGNRASPLDETVVDFAYLLKDRETVPYRQLFDQQQVLAAVVHDELVDITDLCLTGGETQCAAAGLGRGWRLALRESGEKGLSSPLVSNGTVFFTSYIPAGGACPRNEGSSRVYAVKLANGAARLVPGNSVSALERYRPIGPGMPGDVQPWRDVILVPGRGVENRLLFPVPGHSMWPVYWLQPGVDPL